MGVKEKFEDLARKIALNLIYVSLDEEDAFDGIREAIKDNKAIIGRHTKGDFVCKPERFVVVIGAGASRNANQNIKLAGEAADGLIQKLTKNKKDVLELIQFELDRLESVYKLNRNEFETILLALSRFYPKDQIVNKIYEIYKHEHYPSLFYELLAHMFKHRLIDAIINFNFDETLDRAIEDELCQGEYYKVISDGDAPNDINDIMVDNKFKKPLYIKPHGTASHKSTMRFTREDYFILPLDIRNLLESLLSGERRNEPIPVNLIVIGFKMQSIEFNNILSSKLPKGSEIFFVKRSEPEFNTKELKALADKFYKDGFFQIKEDNSSEPGKRKIGAYSALDKTMLKLWEAVCSNFTETYRPREIDRHKLVAQLFSSKSKIKTNAQIKAYLKDRTFIELSLSIAKTKGFLNIHQLTRDRTGIYYNLYQKQVIQQNKKRQTKKRALTLLKFCEALGLQEVGYSREAFNLGKKQLTPPRPDELIVGKDSFVNEHINAVYERLTNNRNFLSASTRQQLKKIESVFKRTLKEMYKGQEVEICPKYENIYSNIFSDPRVLSTTMALRYHSDKMLNEDWDAMLHIAETAEWLFKRNPNLGNKKIEIIVADSTYKDKLEQLYRENLFAGWRIEPGSLERFAEVSGCGKAKLDKMEKLLKPTEEELEKEVKRIIKNESGAKDLKYIKSYNLYVLPWWLHNQHVTIFLKKKDDSTTQILKSIYFSRRLRASNINPVLLDEEDSLAVHESFIAYKLKARKGSYPIVSKSEIEDEQECLLKRICG